ncbi:hypothetical protein DY023_00800 [Microbacterium bovistercoris]|uniref:Uncharacterized protein n=1 Tax=Microbacterium bovistercoris TaxID=2293570 RepID=A0A371NY82_9MICO|nr:hypothetical protein DY023_00800 [Microbacterium bovistercoris]
MLRASFTTEEAVYGVILVAGMIAVSGAHGATSLSVFWTVLVTVVVFWLAHLYAGTVAGHGLDKDRIVGLGESFRHALRRSLGLLLSSLIPLVILLLGAGRLINDRLTIWLALWMCVAVLAVLGYIAFRRRGAPWYIRLLGALTTAAFGIVIILAKALIH